MWEWVGGCMCIHDNGNEFQGGEVIQEQNSPRFLLMMSYLGHFILSFCNPTNRLRKPFENKIKKIEFHNLFYKLLMCLFNRIMGKGN